MRISDWSSDVCSSDLVGARVDQAADERGNLGGIDTEGLGAAAHLHPRTLEVEVGIDAHRESWRGTQMVRDRQRAFGLARRFEIERRAGGDRRLELPVAFARAGKAGIARRPAAGERGLELTPRGDV